jgi:capsular polysaccharide export protein
MTGANEALQRRMFERNRGRIFCFGFQLWKHSVVRAYLRSPGNQVLFPRSARQARRLGFGPGDHALVWGQRHSPEVLELARAHGVPIWRMEDGFLRSVGLGSNLEVPASLVVDREGIYYDPTGPSELETILEAGGFEAAELERAAALRERIVAARLSKYNVGESAALEVPPGRRVVLCPGQVEDDASIQLGCRDIRTNLGLLRAAREAAPDAYIIFKPHPDVLMRNRAGAVDEAQAGQICDHIETRATLADCLEVADEVHTLTSLVGFEALLRGKQVHVHGQPFYAGWGLTRDRHPVARRTRRLSLDELVAGALLRYPRYLDRATGRFTTPEVVIDQLEAERDAAPGKRAVSISWPRRQLRRLVSAYKGVTSAPW